VKTRREETGIGWKERKEGVECAIRREGKGKERGEILNEDESVIKWMKKIWKRRERIEKEP
jgi:hypothetical protein